MKLFVNYAGILFGAPLLRIDFALYFAAVIFTLLLPQTHYTALALIDDDNHEPNGNASTYEDPAILGLALRYNSSDWSHLQNANFLAFTKKSGPPADLIINKVSKPDNLPIFDFAKAKQESLLRKWPTYSILDPIEGITINRHDGVYWTAEYQVNGQLVKSLTCIVENPEGNSAIVMQYIAPATDSVYEASLHSVEEMINSLDFVISAPETGDNGYQS